MASKAITLTRQVKPLLSLDKSEARHRVFALYKAWARSLEPMILFYKLPVSNAAARKVLRGKFEANRHIKDLRVVDMLVIKGQSDLKEVIEFWAEPCHIMDKHFKEAEKERPKDFMSKFLNGQD